LKLANGTIRIQKKGVLPWLVHWALRAITRDFCPDLAALVGSVQNIFFLTVRVHYFNSFVLIAQQARQAVVPGRLSPNMCLCSQHSPSCGQPNFQAFRAYFSQYY